MMQFLLIFLSLVYLPTIHIAVASLEGLVEGQEAKITSANPSCLSDRLLSEENNKTAEGIGKNCMKHGD